MALNTDSYENLKSICLAKIRYLDEQLIRYQPKCDELEEANNDLSYQYCVQEKVWKNTTSRLKVSQEAKDEEKEDLKEWFANEKRALAQEKEDLELQHIQQMKELREQIQKLCTKSMNQDIHVTYEEEKKLMDELERYEIEARALKDTMAREREEHDVVVQKLTQEQNLNREMLIEKLHEARSPSSQEEETLEFLWELFVKLQTDLEKLSDENLVAERDDLKEYMDKVTKELLEGRQEITQLRENIAKCFKKLTKIDTNIKCMEKEEHCLRIQQVRLPQMPPPKPVLRINLDNEIENDRIRSGMAEDIIQAVLIIIKHIQTDSSESKWKMKRLLVILDSASSPATAESCSTSGDNSGLSVIL